MRTPFHPIASRKPTQPSISGGLTNALNAVTLIFLATLSLPNLTLSTPSLDFSASSDNDLLRYAPLGLALFIMIDALNISRVPQLISGALSRDISFQYFFALSWIILLASTFTAKPVSAMNAIVLIVIICNFRMFWETAPSKRVIFYRLASILLFTYLLGAIVLHGLPQNRWVGGIHPNIYGAAIIPCAIFSHMGFRRLGLPLFATAFSLSVMVSSRYAMLSLLAYLGSFYFFRISYMRRSTQIITVASACIALLVVLIFFDTISDVAMLDDPTRGMSSGLSGRSSNYSTFWPQFEENTLLGFGFRMRSEYLGAHNGYLNTWLENGIFIGSLVNFFVIIKIGSSIRPALRRDRDNLERVQGLSAFIALGIASFFQPQLINFGDPMGVAFLLFATCTIRNAASCPASSPSTKMRQSGLSHTAAEG